MPTQKYFLFRVILLIFSSHFTAVIRCHLCFCWFPVLQLRKAQDEIGELQTVNDHLQKRFDKLKSKRKDDT